MAQPAEITPPEEDFFASKWLKREQCWCVADKRMAFASTQFKSCRLELGMQKELTQKREKILLADTTLKVDMTKKWCDEQVLMMRNSCDQQLKLMLEQSNTMITNITDSYNQRLKDTVDLVKPTKTPWFESAAFWGPTAAVLGAGIGILIGAAIWNN